MTIIGRVRKPPKRVGGLPAYRQRRVQEYIAAHLDRDLRLSDLASAAGMSSHYFAELFRRSMGIGPHRFPDDVANAYHAPQSVNYVTSHDRFTLWDLLSYSAKQNMANGHGNTDGPGDIGNWNCGFEGNDGAPAEVIALRNRQAKNLLGLLLLANGTPMLQAGHEFLQTQGGNNNPYNQDSKAHPSLCRSRFWREDITWHGVGPDADLSPESRSLAFHLRGASQGDDDL